MQISISNVIGRAISLGSYASKLIKAFKARVLSYPNSIFEAEACLNTTLSGLNSIKLLDNASLIITPNAYNEGILYDVVPNTTLGDMNVVRATTATRVNEQGLIESVGLNIPRIDYTNGSCPSLLVEPQRTNLVPNPFAYTGSGVAFNSTVANSPISGGLSTRITKNEAAGTLRYAQQTCSASALLGSTNYTISAFFKYDGYDVQTSMEYNNSGQWGTTSWVQLINIASTGITLGTSSDCTSTIQNYGNGWYRVNVTILTGATITSTPPVTYLMRVASTLSTGQGFLHTAVQLEAGSYPTSYIPTVASSVTRNADVISKTGISSLIGQTEGTIFFDGIVNGCQNSSANLLNGARNVINSFGISYVKSTKNIVSYVYESGTTKSLISGATIEIGQRFKVAYSYKSGDSILYVNGVQIGTSVDTFTFPSALSEINIGDSITYFNFQESILNNSAQLYKTRLSNTELAQLTTL